MASHQQGTIEELKARKSSPSDMDPSLYWRKEALMLFHLDLPTVYAYLLQL
jgi:hypothetical protein